MELEDDAALSSELDALERHRMRHLARFPNAPLERDDPDVRRIIEALALFSVRTRRIARRNVTDAVARLFRQYFAYLLDPAPASARVTAETGPNFADAVDVPRGTELHFSALSGAKGHAPLSMVTLEALRVLPLTVERVGITLASGKELAISLLSKHSRKNMQLDQASGEPDSMGELSFEINHLSEFAPSVAVMDALQRNVVGIAVDYDGGPRRPDEHETVEVTDLGAALSFGASTPTLAELAALDQPLQRIRTFFHDPWSELRFSLRLPRPTTLQAWHRVRLRFELRNPWPRHLILQRESFRLNTVAVVNLKRDWASTIACDGTRTRHPILHPLPTAQLSPHSIIGVYEFTPKGPSPMKPSTIANGDNTYEVEVQGTGPTRKMSLSLDRPDAFEQGVTIGIEALWHQPLPKDQDGAAYQVGLAGGFISNVSWRTSSLAPAAEAVCESDAETLLRILALKHQTVLSRNEFVFLLEQLGAGRLPEMQAILTALTEVRRNQIPFARGIAGVKTIYTLIVRDLDTSMVATVSVVAPRLREFLCMWCEEEVEVEVQLPQRKDADLSEVDVRLHHMPRAARGRASR